MAAPLQPPRPAHSSLVTVPPAVGDAAPPPREQRPLPMLVRIALGIVGIFLLLIGIKQLRYRGEPTPIKEHELPPRPAHKAPAAMADDTPISA